MNTTRFRLVSWVLLLALAIIWGSSFILMKRGMYSADGSDVFSSYQVASLRLVFAGLVLIPFGLSSIRKLPSSKIGWMVLVGLMGNGIPAFLFTYAQTHLDSGFAGMLNSLTPVFTVIVGYLVFRNVPHKLQVVGVLIGLTAAIGLIFLQDGIQGVGSWNYALYIVFATMCYAFSVNIIRHRLEGIRSEVIAAIALFFAAIPSLVYLTFSDFIEVMDTNVHAYSSVGYVAILGVIGTALALVIFNRLIHMTSAVFATSVTYLIPLVAMGWGVFDGEKLGIGHISLIALMLGGIYLIHLKKR